MTTKNTVAPKDLEARIKTLEEIVKSQAAEIRTLKDIEEIKKLQKAYGYYLEHWMAKEIIDLFSDDSEVSLTLGLGTYLGKAGVKRYFEYSKPDNELIHQLMQLSGMVDIDRGGKTAKGRWYGYGALSMPQGKGTGQFFMGGIYTAEYIKEDGAWKFKKLQFDIIYTAKPLEGWVKPERLAAATSNQVPPAAEPDMPRTYDARYPSGYVVPFHYKHPVTGKETSEKSWNATLKRNAQ